MESKTAPVGDFEIVLFLMGMILTPIVWWFVAGRQRGAGKKWYFAHFLGISAGLFVFLSVIFSLIALTTRTGIFPAFVICGLTIWTIRAWSSPTVSKPVEQAIKQESTLQSSPSQVFVEEDSDLVMMFSAKHSDIDLAEDECKFGLHDAFAEIEFDYLNASGARSHRTVDVWAVDDEYFEGYCRKANGTRTFLIGRIRGKVLVHDTGELLTPRQWATIARADERNAGIVDIGRDNRCDNSHHCQEPHLTAGTEILFTGFGKAHRADLENIAKESGMVVRKSVTKGLTYLCIGPNAGPTKLSDAIDAGASVIDQGEFLDLANQLRH